MAIDFDAAETPLVLLHFHKDICGTGGAMAPSDSADMTERLLADRTR